MATGLPFPRSAGRSAGLIAMTSLLAGSAAIATVRAEPQTHVVNIDGLRFEPATLVVNRGDRVTWINKDPFPHTVTARAKAFDSGNLNPGATWSLVAQTQGTYEYGCLLHPTMTGKLIVRGQAPAGDRR